jgi:uncharacterized protein (DUF983 family)
MNDTDAAMKTAQTDGSHADATTQPGSASPPWPTPPLFIAMGRGAVGLCPTCGGTRLFTGYLRVAEDCTACGAPVGQVRADDGPPIFTMLIASAIVVTLLVVMEGTMNLSMGTEAAILLPLMLVLSLALLRPIKGATLGLMLQLGIVKPPTQ